MPHTPYPDVDELLESLHSRIRAVLGERLAGLYLYGSLTTGDFDPA
jgi:predicted nucleotidyltransferase